MVVVDVNGEASIHTERNYFRRLDILSLWLNNMVDAMDRKKPSSKAQRLERA